MQRLAAMLVVAATLPFALAGDSAPKDDQAALQGRWECISGPSRMLRRELDFKGTKVTSTFETQVIRSAPKPGTFRLSDARGAKGIDMHFAASKESSGKPLDEAGIYKVEGDVLTICTADRRPTEFGQKGADVNVYQRIRDDAKPTQGDLKKLQGKWTAKVGKKGHAIFEFKGKKVSMEVSEKGNFTGTVDGEVRLNESADPKTIDIIKISRPIGGEFEEMRGIYKLEGDTLTLSTGGESSEKYAARPAEFKGKNFGEPPLLRIFARGEKPPAQPEPEPKAKAKTKKKAKGKAKDDNS